MQVKGNGKFGPRDGRCMRPGVLATAGSAPHVLVVIIFWFQMNARVGAKSRDMFAGLNAARKDGGGFLPRQHLWRRDSAAAGNFWVEFWPTDGEMERFKCPPVVSAEYRTLLTCRKYLCSVRYGHARPSDECVMLVSGCHTLV